MKQYMHLISRFLAVLVVLLCVASPAYAFNVFGNACSTGAGGTTSAVCQDGGTPVSTNPLTGSNGIIITIANIVALIAGAVAVIMVVYGGWQYVTSGGEASKTQAAKSTIFHALIGIVIIGASYTIISFVMSKI